MTSKSKWLLFSISGLATVGFGLSLLGEAIIYKYEQHPNWIFWGTVALVVTNTGICLIGQAILEKARG